ncbi:MAG: BatD family protein [Candidatus Marinimicrobia bacterium]|nr:BatD family protein [Candidatus Neomarinimicrobiota bacterium]MDP6853367.1 BatD family protein [Candidatus Neomarinimicrobiota bacterium]MDP6936760.1 BatD family protein [Candidatus Neomarinimicrobiota bacterium]
MIQKLLILFLGTALFAQGTVNISVDRRKINEGESINLTVTAQNVKGDPQVNLPTMEGLKVVSGPNQSSSTNVQFLNGRMTKTSTVTLTYILIPTRTGKVTIPAMTIKTGKQNFSSQPITITVGKRGSKISGASPKYFIEAEVDTENPYRGEQVTLTYTVYTKVDITSFEEELPKFKGLWTEELYAPKNLSLREVQKHGVRYYAATVRKLALFPTSSGELPIEPMTAVIGIREKQNRWNDFSLFGPPSTKHTVSTNAITLKVKPVPDRKSGKESAAVGQWNIQSYLSSKKVKQNEAVTYRISLKGTGNILAVDISDLQFPNELEVFEPKIQTTESPLRDKIGGEKTFEWVLIPRFAGDIALPKVQFDYFDPELNKWQTKATPGYRLQVTPNEKSLISSKGLSKEEVALMAEDIRFMDESKPVWQNKNRNLFSTTALTLLLLSGLSFGFPFIRNVSREQYYSTESSRRSRNALKSALKDLEQSSSDPVMTYTAIYQAVVGFINHKTGNSTVEYSKNLILQSFSEKISKEEIQNLMDILTRGEAVRFAPISSEDALADKTRIKEILTKAHHDWK